MSATPPAGRGAAPATVVIDDDGTVIAWTRAAEGLLGYRASEVVGRSGAVLLTPGDHRERLSAWTREYGHLDRWSGLAEARHSAGHPVMLHLQGHRLTTPVGRPTWVVSARPASMGAPGGSVVEPLIQRSPVAMWIWDRELRCVWRNVRAWALQEFLLTSPDDVPGRDDAPALGNEEVRRVLRRVLDDGAPVVDNEVHWPSSDGLGQRTLSISIFRLEGVDGGPVGVCSLAIDVTQSLARERLAMLVEASARIGTSLDVRQTAQELADYAVPALADYAAVDLVEPMLPDQTPVERPGGMEVGVPVFRRAGAASISPGLPESPWARGEAVFVPPDSPWTRVLSTGRAHFEPEMDTSPGTWLDHDPARARTVRLLGMHSLMIVPLRARGETLGVTAFVRSRNPAPFTRDDLLLAEELAARAALSLDSAHRYTRERTAALALQRNLLPRRLCDGGALDVAYRYLPSGAHGGVGGDWYDTIPLSGGRIALVVGDVTGHGINAAATMGRIRTAVRTLAYMDMPPGELLTQLDNLISRLHEQDVGADGAPLPTLGSTCLYAVYDPATRRCTMATAGHPPPAVVGPDGRVAFLAGPTGPPVGLNLEATHDSFDVELPPGTLLALYTDGLIERRQDDLDTGMARLRAALADYADLPLERLCTGVIDVMVGGRAAEDDVALLVARTR
ncbi:SpoIIE family protein phosphatase [Nonomuraea aridisoli]|nr:SpoIIE family protein phosphatase [Nonomuraea aridisoli]